ncbi:Por secretion system C-terminal sorting domain-containing protein [Cyclobacterium xiamenense]|uniref:Por secretion system C-terminal sorting domain-containing protein n=1 Tax=Cyclobacterium xiamenense TaxID=1297121 RepID=A0A1H6X0F2_9BACT|nr:FG-GAP-like repeat-containing protein [Cyclobacterium xiamenense]SEJ21024.1 Por secretion system C-terminal sorting domain-containing protein [Cyclobacterium xiamenense]
MRQFYLILFLSLFLILRSTAQDLFRLAGDTPQVTISGVELPMPFAGGINAAQVQEFDLNGDGREELVIWDINAGRIHAYAFTESGYRYFPGAAYYFPDDINGFLLLADFNGDGKKDLFTGSPFGIKAYRNGGTTADQFPDWVVERDFLRLESGSNLTANILDVPLIEDLDGDGDLDILTFNFATGDYLEFFKNTSVERTGQPSVDGFASAVTRWGKFEFCGCGAISFGLTCAGQPMADREPDADLLRTLHSGGHTLLYRDFDNDGVKDLLIGQDQCEVLYYLPNEGSDTEPVFQTFTNDLPGFGPLPEFPIFHSAFVLEENLLVSSHSSEPIINTGSDFSRSMYLLQPGLSGTIETSGFLQDRMVDLGENSRPYFLGNRLQGSLFVAANILDPKGVQGRIFEMEWADNQIRLVNEDYLDLSALEVLEPSYQRFTSAANQTYHLITGDVYNGQIPEKQIWLLPFDAPEERVSLRIPDFTLRGMDQVYFFHDSREDYLLLARQTGELLLFSLALDGSPEVRLLEREFLGFADNPVSRNLTVAVSSGPEPYLVAVDQRGVLYSSVDILGAPETTPVSIQLEGRTFERTRYGRNTWISLVPGLLGEKPDLIIGNRAGGLEYLSRIPNPDEGDAEVLKALVFPNPSEDNIVQLVVNQAGVTVSVYDSTGKLLKSGLPLTENERNELNLWGYPPALYLLEFQAPRQRPIHKKLWIGP